MTQLFKTPAFKRSAGALPDVPRRMPSSDIKATTSPRTIGELLGRLENYTRDEAEQHRLYPWATRFVLGYPLPSWQRQLCWSLDQKTRFINSLWLDVDVGSYLVNEYFEFTDDGALREFSEILLDGQQRLTALQEYVLNVFPVTDANGVTCFWKELGISERRLFGNKAFNMTKVNSSDEAVLREIYDLRSFGGVRHTEDERASPKEAVL